MPSRRGSDAKRVVAPVQPTSVVENRHDRHGNLMQGLMTIDSFVAELKDTMALDRRCHKAKTPPDRSDGVS